MHAGIKGPPSSASGDHAPIFRSSRDLVHKERDFLPLDVARSLRRLVCATPPLVRFPCNSGCVLHPACSLRHSVPRSLQLVNLSLFQASQGNEGKLLGGAWPVLRDLLGLDYPILHGFRDSDGFGG